MKFKERNAIFTIASKNYLAFARTLLGSVKRHHDDVDLFLLLSDESEGTFEKEKEGFNVIEARELRIPEFEKMAFMYNIIELNTAMKPFFINYLIERGYKKIIYLDPDVMVFDKLSVIFDLLNTYSMVLTPHLTKPLSRGEFCFPPENVFLLTGTFNLGFIGLSNTRDTREFIDWWAGKCSNQCFVEAFSGLFVDQKWCNLIPGFFESVYVLRHQGCNMAVWNLHERKLQRNLVNGKDPLIFYHFSGFNPEEFQLITRHQDMYTLTNRQDLAEIFMSYKNLLLGNGYEYIKNWPYKYGTFDNGVLINSVARQLYSLVCDDYPQPFSSTENSYYSLLLKKRLIHQTDRIGIRNQIKESNGKVRKKSKTINAILKIIARLLGPNRYISLMNYIHYISVLRHQDFLIK